MHILYILLLSLLVPSHQLDDIVEHEFHLSKSMLKYSDSENAIQISLHLFIDDFELALAEKGVDSLHLCTTMEKKNADEYIERYLTEKLQISINDSILQLNYLGKEISDDLAGVWVYLEAENVENPSSLEVTNRLLTEMFEDQRNLMNVSANNKEDYLMFTAEDNTKIVTWE